MKSKNTMDILAQAGRNFTIISPAFVYTGLCHFPTNRLIQADF